MKKIVLSIAFLIVAVVGAQAQVSFGVKGGVNFSKITTDDVKKSSVAGYQAGVFARIGNGWYLQPELYLGSRGGKFEYQANSSTTVTATDKVTFTTLNVPLLLGRKFGLKNANVRIMAGLIYSYNLSTNKNFAYNASDAYADFGEYNNSTLGYQAGAGVDIGHITADLRYEGGLSYINSNYGQRANLIALSVGFKIF
ncbi:PorT family protein [Mucilaginibacter robiniae]|uniref:PorT family protein n=1 Tax=Mucilaginibacter robiniae TaxID=2728022 RepID=A0A7L5E099_9SPHI|nr:porin family protein [Mucilaginibacter robiniae]QJD95918.1 PorT family protein [Mucilaginibacter robiniae]